MREILFRGKRADNGEWIEGCFLDKNNIGIFYDDTEESDCTLHIFSVTSETVGQFTGLTDKNGKRIFEGDILDTPDRLVVVTWLDANAQFDCDFLGYAHGIEITNFKGIFPRNFDKYEVIGNIHDNPELLKGGVDNG